MDFENSSLQIAAFMAASAVTITLVVSWLAGKTGNYLATCAVAMMAIVIAICLSIIFTNTSGTTAGYLASLTLLAGLTIGHAGSHQFRYGHFSSRVVSAILVMSGTIVTLPTLAGFDGLAMMITNILSALILAAIAWEYWQCRTENSTIIISLSGFYLVMASAFVAAAAMLMIETPIWLNGPPSNWAESVKLIVAVLSISGIGALSITVNHQRLVHRHRDASRTDVLTGMLNRRALFEQFGDAGLPARAAVIVFDLDNFKIVNDTYGHAAGDELLKKFAEVCDQKTRQADTLVRLGGEEFVAILPDSSKSGALAVAEAIRVSFAVQSIDIEGRTISCTVSSGIFVCGANHTENIDKALRAADGALYRAKSGGRNRVSTISRSMAA